MPNLVLGRPRVRDRAYSARTDDDGRHELQHDQAVTYRPWVLLQPSMGVFVPVSYEILITAARNRFSGTEAINHRRFQHIAYAHQKSIRTGVVAESTGSQEPLQHGSALRTTESHWEQREGASGSPLQSQKSTVAHDKATRNTRNTRRNRRKATATRNYGKATRNLQRPLEAKAKVEAVRIRWVRLAGDTRRTPTTEKRPSAPLALMTCSQNTQ